MIFYWNKLLNSRAARLVLLAAGATLLLTGCEGYESILAL
jgi:hypothetical protein